MGADITDVRPLQGSIPSRIRNPEFVTLNKCSHVGGIKSVPDADCLEDAVRAVEGVHGIKPRLIVEVLVVAGGGVGVGLLQPLCPQAVL
jgi:hypothetical protein